MALELLPNIVRVTCRVHRDIEPIDGKYTITHEGIKKQISDKYFTFVLESPVLIGNLHNIIDFSEIEAIRIKYDRFNDYNWSSSGE